MLGKRGLSGLAFIVATIASGRPALAAELRWNAPSGCAGELDVREQVERLIGRELASVEGMSFDVELKEIGQERWLLRLETTSGTERGIRELRGASCAEVVDAGAVAMSMAVQGRANEDEDSPPAETLAETPEEPAPAVAPAPGPVQDRGITPKPKRSPAPSFAVGLGLTADVGALPSASPGAELDLQLSVHSFRLLAVGAFYATQSAELAGDRGGEFTLWLGGLLGCAQRPLANWQVFGCLGYELGSLAGEGTGVTDPRLGAYLWQAARAEVGISAPLSADLRLEARAGAAVPLNRSEFVLQDRDVVHRPASLSARGFAGVVLRL